MNKRHETSNQVLMGDIRTVAGDILDDSIQSVITSPPYFGHRSYCDTDGPKK